MQRKYNSNHGNRNKAINASKSLCPFCGYGQNTFSDSNFLWHLLCFHFPISQSANQDWEFIINQDWNIYIYIKFNFSLFWKLDIIDGDWQKLGLVPQRNTVRDRLLYILKQIRSAKIVSQLTTTVRTTNFSNQYYVKTSQSQEAFEV